MYVITLTYTAPLEMIDAALPGHVRWLEAAYADGVFLVSGRRVPRTGGVILARPCARDVLEQRLAEDPFAKAGLARYDILEFIPTMTADVLAPLRETPAVRT
ncbi:YciI family protein [Gulbenkiania mobilis]|uniref:Uncharacterized protein YciI n=1 Tax=Gulbenkiania mobilis TaxID=397457 RepID=A0ABY2CU91_GULMO|nr:uncharacterized protein YciI [Gulbenkiania mobilis]